MGDEFELEYDVQEVCLSKELVYKVTTVANEALPLEMLLQLESRRCRRNILVVLTIVVARYHTYFAACSHVPSLTSSCRAPCGVLQEKYST